MNAVESLDILVIEKKLEIFVLTDYTFLSPEGMILVVWSQSIAILVNSSSISLLQTIGSEVIASRD